MKHIFFLMFLNPLWTFWGVTALSVMGHPVQSFDLRIYCLIRVVDSFPLNSWPIALQFLNKAFWVLSHIIPVSDITASNMELQQVFLVSRV